MKKVFVSGCFDLLHSGHVAFFEEAATHGDLYVGIGSDKTVFDLKGRRPVNSEAERLYMVSAVKYVKEARINRGSGILDFEPELEDIRPDILFVNEDGHSADKEQLCRRLGIRYVVSRRTPRGDLPSRSTTALRQECRIPYRIDLAGGWLDQPFVSRFHPGPVITVSIEPDYEFNDRSGMATSTRKKAIDLWQAAIPAGNPEFLAKQLFAFENPPGTEYVSGSQDALGIVIPGAARLFYSREKYWPSNIDRILDGATLDWLESRLSLATIHPRTEGFDVLENMNVNAENAGALAEAAERLWKAIPDQDEVAFGKAMIDSFNAQVRMFPNMMNSSVQELIDAFQDQCAGFKLSGAGGGGYLVLFGKDHLPGSLPVRIRRNH